MPPPYREFQHQSFECRSRLLLRRNKESCHILESFQKSRNLATASLTGSLRDDKSKAHWFCIRESDCRCRIDEMLQSKHRPKFEVQDCKFPTNHNLSLPQPRNREQCCKL